jgi:PAS domain S-box-containing protein
VHSSEDAIIGETLDGIITDWTAGAERLYTYEAREIIGKSISTLGTPERPEEMAAILERIGRGERVHPFDTVRRRKDGSLVDVAVTVAPIRDKNDRIIGAAAIHRNISERLRLEEEVRQSQKMEAIGQLAGGVAHDFNNLLTIINGYSAMLLGRPSLDASARSMAEEIQKAGERSASLTAQLLAFSRRQVLEPQLINLNECVKNVEKLLRRLIGEDVTLTTTLSSDLGNVRVDPGQIDQVIINLAVNARDAMPRGGKLIMETAHVDLDEVYAEGNPGVWAGRYVLLVVSDTGVGIDESTQAHIFEPFFTTKAQGQGTGLGLAVVHGIIAQSGGHISVSSKLGQGTTFKIYFPQVEGLRTTRKSHAGTGETPRGSETILLVEDEGAVRKLALRTLEMAGYTVLEAAHGGEGVRVAEQHQGPIHLLVSDVVMPEMGGCLLAERLAATRPGMKVLFLSGYTDDAMVRHGVLSSEINFLQKPFSPDALARKVREVLHGIIGPETPFLHKPFTEIGLVARSRKCSSNSSILGICWPAQGANRGR